MLVGGREAGTPDLPRATKLVEDDQTLAQTLIEALESSGYRVLLAKSAADAEIMLWQTQPHLIVLDLTLPEADGLVLCSKLKAISAVPIVICSATGQKPEAVLRLRLGADDFIRKPFDIDELQARIKAVLRRATRRRTAKATPSLMDHVRIGELLIERSRRRTTLGGRQSISHRPSTGSYLLWRAGPTRSCRGPNLQRSSGVTRMLALREQLTSTCGGCGRNWSRHRCFRHRSSLCVAPATRYRATRCARIAVAEPLQAVS